MSEQITEVTHVCAQCGHTQIIRYWPDEKQFPATCCVKCRAGFGVELQEQLIRHIGMFPQE